MYNKKKCSMCKYRTSIQHGYNATDLRVCCGYSLKTNQTCLKANGEDIRGSDPNQCNLYEQGAPERKQITIKR